jgi:hypothetical protein
MTWSTARAQIITMIEGVGGLSQPGDYGPRFEHDPELLGVDGPGRARRFGLRAVRAVTHPMATGTTSRRAIMDCDLVVDYPKESDDSTLDAVIWSDYEAIRERALLDESTWGRPSSTIMTFVLDGMAIDGDTEDITGGDGKVIARRLTIRFPVMHQG